MKISCSLLEYVKERRIDIDRHEREQYRIQREKEIEERGNNRISYAEYQELKRRAESGDEEAQNADVAMSMPKKVKPEIVYVKCRNCKNASDFGDNSAYCKAKGHRVCACDRYGQICNSFKRS